VSEAESHGITSFIELNDRFMAWAEQVCNTRRHAETGQTPIDRFTSQGPFQNVEPSRLSEAFRWSVQRRVTSTASVSLAGNRYSVDPALIGRRVELRFDPEDLTRLDVFWEGRPIGQAIPFIIARHVHHQVPQAQPPTPPPSTGVDYLGMIVAAHEEQLLASASASASRWSASSLARRASARRWRSARARPEGGPDRADPDAAGRRGARAPAAASSSLLMRRTCWRPISSKSCG
jgi:putative transposase